MKKLLIILLCLLPSLVHAQKTKTALTTEVNTNFASGSNITAATLRATVLDIINSYYDLNGGTTLSCAAHNWVSALPTLSSITCTQPAFTDITGSITAAQCVTPTASTIGCIESYVAVTHQWINAISTVGVPSSTQPAIGDVSGWGTGVLTAVGLNVGSAGAPVLFNGALGTPSSGTLTNTTGFPVSGLSGTGTGVNTALATNTNTTGGFPTYTATTWTPAVSTTSTPGTPAYSIQVGSYEQIGRQVTARFTIALSGWTGSPTGNVTITGLPVASANTTNDYGACHVYHYTFSGLTAANVAVGGYITAGTSVVNLEQGSNTATSVITAAQAGTTPVIQGICNYHT